MLRETYPKHRFNRVSSKIPDVGTIGLTRLKRILRFKDNALHDKKAEISGLREKNQDLRLVINMIVVELNK